MINQTINPEMSVYKVNFCVNWLADCLEVNLYLQILFRKLAFFNIVKFAILEWC